MPQLLDNDNDFLEEDSQKGKYLTFFIERECFGIEIKHVTEIIGIQKITEVPEMPTFIQGIINLRGKIIPVMDVRLRFKKPFQEYNDRTCIIVINMNDVPMGLIVDRVSEVTSIADHDIVLPPELNHIENSYVKGIGKVGTDVKLLLDCNRLLNEGQVEQLQTI